MYDLPSIRRANPIADIVAQSGVKLRRQGRRLAGRCPFHPDSQPSFVVYPQDASYFCFGCGAGGDVIDFVARLNGFGFRQAVALLSGSPVTAEGRSERRCAFEFRTEPPGEAELRVIDAAAQFYHECLWSTPAALAYLALRGIDRRTARTCRVGYGASGLAPHLRRRGFRLDYARAVGLLAGRRESMLGRIVIPDLSNGQAIWMTGRVLSEAEPRYMNLRLPTPLLGLSAVEGQREVIVVEGVFDWLTLVQWGLPAVALLGVRVSKRTVDALRPFRRVYVALDSDEAGCRASAQLAHALGQRATVLDLPAGVHDVNDLGRSSSGRQAFEYCLELATNGKEPKWQRTDEPRVPHAA